MKNPYIQQPEVQNDQVANENAEEYGWYNPVGWFSTSEPPQEATEKAPKSTETQPNQEQEIKPSQQEEEYGWYNPVGWVSSSDP